MILTASPFKMLLYSTFVVVFISDVAVPWMACVQSEQCQDAVALQHRLTCSITNDTCCWVVNDPSSQPLWTIDNGSRRFVVESQVNGTVQLRSPLICPTNGLSSLRFLYKIQGSTFELSVFLDEDGDNKPLWSTNKSNNNDKTSNITINNQMEDFKIVLQWKMLHTQFSRIELGDIFFIYWNQESGSTSQSTDGESSGCTIAGGESPGSGSFLNESSGGELSGGGIAGIIVSLVVIIVVLVIAFFLLRRRKTGEKLPFQKLFGRLRTVIQTSSGSTTEAQAVPRTNRPIIDGPYPEITSESGHLPKTKDYYSVPSDSLQGNHKGTKLGHGTQYAVSDAPESSNYYSMPQDSTGAHGGGKQTGDNPGYVAEDDGGYSTPDDIDRLEDTQKTNTTQTARSGKKGANGDSYNKNSFQPPHAGSSRNAADTYHHISPIEHADISPIKRIEDDDNEYKMPRSEHAEYSLATDPGDPYDRPPATPTGKAQNTDLAGKRGAPRANNTDYNHLKLKDGGSPPTGATSGKGKGQGVYSHLGGQVQIDNYNRVDFDGRGGDNQTGNSGGPYNHLGD